MKEWKDAEVQELNVTETANGSHNLWDEGTELNVIGKTYVTKSGSLS